MNKQSGMTLLEVLLAMSIFTAVALTLNEQYARATNCHRADA